MKTNCKGNVLVYVLIAVALLAALTYAVSGENRGTQTTQIDSARAKLWASDLIKHATAAEIAVKQMGAFGVDLNEVKFDLPSEAGYSVDPTLQIYHPRGGGLSVLNVNDSFFDANGTVGWKWQGNVNVGWTKTAATDLIYSFINVSTSICEQINQQLTNSKAIPLSTVNFTNTFTESVTDDDLTAVECAACENVYSLCISDGTTNAFYTIIGSR